MDMGVKIGKYTFLIIKEDESEPVRLERKLSTKEKLVEKINKNNQKLNLIIIITLMILFLMVCFTIVPQTYGYF